MSKYHDELYEHLNHMRKALLSELDRMPGTVRYHVGMYILKTLQAELEHMPNAVTAMQFEEHKDDN